jgi:ABC-type transport system substrate-binding protein
MRLHRAPYLVDGDRDKASGRCKVARRWRYLAVTIAVTTAAALGLSTGCSAGSAEPEGLTADGLVPFLNYGGYAPGTSPQRNFNPFSPNRAVINFTFETLYQVDQNGCTEHPWLATAYKWDGTKKLTFTLRDGVKWHDGKPLTADDVVFTYEMIKKNPALDLKGVGPVLDKISGKGNTVTMEFDSPAVLLFSKIAMVEIVPKHIWEKQKDPVTFTNPGGVGTGPYKVKTFNARQMVLERDPQYWQADKVRVKELRFSQPGEGPTDQLRLGRGEYDMNSMFVPDIDKVFVSKDPAHNRYWFAPGGVISLGLNLTKAPFDDVAFRKALTYGINRQEIADKAQFGYVETASQTGLILPNQKQWLDPDIPDQGKIGFDKDKADKALEDAGYEKDGSGHRLGKDGKPLHFELMIPAGWSDWIAGAQFVKGDLEDLGIQIDVATPQVTTHDQNRATGRYDMFFTVYGGDCNIQKDFADPLSSAQTADIGKPAVSNFTRWKDQDTDDLLAQLAAAGDEKAQQEAVHGLEKIMMDQVPNIPMWYGARWFEYRTARATGWPNEKDPYAAVGDNLIVVTHLKPAGS